MGRTNSKAGVYLAMFKKLEKYSLDKVGLFQALGLTLYCTIVSLIIINGNELFGPMNKAPFLGPILFLTLFVVSALICALIALSYPIYLFWDKKNTEKALALVGYTACWLTLFVTLILATLIFLK